MMKTANRKAIFAILAIAACVVVTLILFITHTINRSSQSDGPGSSQEVASPLPKKTIVCSYGGNDVTVRQLIRTFQELNPDIEVKLQQLPSSTDYQRSVYEIALSSGDTSIDVFFADIVWIAELASNNRITALDDYFGENMRKEFLANALDACSYKGKIYAVPLRTDAPFLYYRKDIISTPPTTYSELIAQTKKHINDPGIKYGYVLQGYSYEGLVCNALEFIWNNGGSVLENGKVAINSPQSIEGLQTMIDLIHSGISSEDVLTFQEDDSIMAFNDGSSIFLRNWPYAYRFFNAYDSKVKGKVGIAPLPKGPQGTVSSGTLGGWNLVINKNSKNPDLAWRLIQWMSSYEAQALDNRLGGYAPTRKSVYNDAELNRITPWISEFKNIFEAAKPRPVSPYYSSISGSMQKNFSDALYRKIDAKTAIENIEKDLNLLLSKQTDK